MRKRLVKLPDKLVMRKMNCPSRRPSSLSSVVIVLSTLLFLSSLFSESCARTTTIEVRCNEQEYLCSGGRTCIRGSFVCDGVVDCPQGDDEQECTHHKHGDQVNKEDSRGCDIGFYECSKSDVCLPLSLVCDGHPDCPFQDDELSCKHSDKESTSQDLHPNILRASNSHQILKREEISRSKESQQNDDITKRRASSKSVSNDESTKTEKGIRSDALLGGFDWNAMEDQYNKGKNSHGNYSAKQNETGVNVKATKLIPSTDFKPIAYSHTGSGYFFINFGNIVTGENNVNGPGNDLGNGNGNGNHNGPQASSESQVGSQQQSDESKNGTSDGSNNGSHDGPQA